MSRPTQLDEGLEHESGLLGVAGSADMRELLEREASGDERAALAIELFVRRAAEWIAAAATALPRLDGARVHRRDRRARGAGPQRGSSAAWECWVCPVTCRFGREDAILAARGAGAAVLRVAAREDLVIAEATRRLLD